MNQGGYQGLQPGMGSNQQFLQPNNYDPRRLFPFGLSPIPEVPSELASEVSSIASYSPTPTLDDSDTEIESVRSRGSIMYSGSCDSVKSNVTLHGKSSSSSTDTEQDSSEDDEEEDEGFKVEPIAEDPPASKSTSVIVENLDISSQKTSPNNDLVQEKEYEGYEEEEDDEEDALKQLIDTDVQKIVFPCDIVSGAATASEIFRHLQATRGKQEVTTELAKILTVLKTTLNSNDKDSSSSDDESSHTEPKSISTASNAVITGKPPKPPKQIKFSKKSVISPAIQARIRELEQNKPGNPKEEMNLLSKILVHLLCSCKTTAAAQELKRIIRQFKEVAKVAMEEGGSEEATESLRSSSRASSRNSRRKIRSRTASGNSNISGNSETDSMNTLTPGDSKSSGTDDETAQDVSKLRFTSDANVGSQCSESDTHTISYTLTIPLKKVYEEQTAAYADNDNQDGDDEEWEWEYEEEEESASPCSKNNSSGSSRNQTPSEGKSDISTGSTRKILLEMEMGAYNSGSASHSDQGNSQSTPITEEEDALIDDEDDKGKIERHRKKPQEKLDGSGHLFCHLEETFKVLSDTYQIITTGNSPENQSRAANYTPSTPDKSPMDKAFEDILDGVSNQCVQLESQIMRSSRQSTATPDNIESTTEQSELKCTPQTMQKVGSRPGSRSSRPVSRQKVKTPVNNNEEEDWGDEDEWEYYYEEDYPETTPEDATDHVSPKTSRPGSRILVLSRPVSRQTIIETGSQNSTAQLPTSRPSSRIIVRVPSRAASRLSVKNQSTTSTEEQENEDWGDEDEWEYYYEEDYPEEQSANESQSNANSSRPASRPASRPSSRCVSRQKVPEEVCNIIRAHSRLAEEGTKVVLKTESGQVMMIRSESRQETESRKTSSRANSRVPSRAASRTSSRAKSVQKGNDQEEDWGDEEGWEYYYEEDYPDEAAEPANQSAHVNANQVINPAPEKAIQIIRVKSRPSSRQSVTSSRPNSRSDSRPVSRATSRTASRIKRTTSALGNVDEEDEGEWYLDDCEDAELRCLSPSLTTAPTTRATSPFPDEKGKVEVHTGTGFSRRKLTFIKETEETSPVSRTPTNRDSITGSVTPKYGTEDRADTGSKTPSFYQKGYLNPMAGVSVALAAEYLGQDAEQLAASLPAKFIEDNQVLHKEKKKKHKSKHKCEDEEDEDKGEGKEKRRKRKDKDGKFLPKLGVKELASRLEPHLFQDTQVGKKMLISKEEVRDVIRESKKRNPVNNSTSEVPKISHGLTKSEEKRKSVREMVQLIANQSQMEDLGYCDPVCTISNQNFGIPSISMSSNLCPQQAAPQLPPVYFSSPSPQFSQAPYQHYPVDVHGQFPQYPQSPYQPYPPQPPPPYQQYGQQFFQGYPPPPQPPQQYQQYPQPYPAYLPSMQPYPTGYQPYGVQPIVYQSETNPSQMKVVSGGLTTVVNMRQKSNISPATPRQSGIPAKVSKSPRNSPEGSEAYGTGSTGSDQTEGQATGIDHEDGGGAEQEDGSQKPNKRHSRLFKLLQDSDYTDSDNDSRADFSRISMKNVEDNHSRESDIDSICSGLERTGVERKHSFRSHKSSNKESDNESISSGMERKISPNSVQNNIKHRRFMQLNLQANYEPSSSELSTPNSPTGLGPADRKRTTSKPPPSRVWNYHAEDFDSHAGVSDDSSYQSLQSMNSFDSLYDNIAGREVEEIMKRKVTSGAGLYRYQTESPSTYVRASPKSVDLLRGSPKTHSSSSPKLENYNRASPKLEQELFELTNFPSSPGLSLMQLHGHRSFYGAGK